jgi:diphosphomevalonate decarboxylase
MTQAVEIKNHIGRAKAPANIALIKYMGKKNAASNLPANASLSLTLNELCTLAEVRRVEERVGQKGDVRARWISELPEICGNKSLDWKVPLLSEKGEKRILSHLSRLLGEFPPLLQRWDILSDVSGKFELRTANSFPQGAGLASSASSFAAVTMATLDAIVLDKNQLRQVWEREVDFKVQVAELSRKGSGSSCRSFLGPWVAWEKEEVELLAEPLKANFPSMIDFVLIVSSEEKVISSSEAHQRVTTSPLWGGRVGRANERFLLMKEALGGKDFMSLSKISWEEFWEMHSLFHTARPNFTYWRPETLAILNTLFDEKEKTPFPLIVTMDAGANVHVLVLEKDERFWTNRFETIFPDVQILRDTQGQGASFY